MRWGVEKRLEFIEFRLFWEGGINRSDIIEQFGVSVPQASKDLTLYEAKAPGNLSYDKSAKRYRASPKFRPVFLEPDPEAYLAQLLPSQTPIGNGDSESWLAKPPAFDSMPVPHRRVDAKVLRTILSAIRERQSLEVFYQSMSGKRPAPQWRWISPHALGQDGLRWHVRAYCHEDGKFKDFILSRCLKTRGVEPSTANPDDDRFWHDKFVVSLMPNPALSENQQEIIAQDYCMRDGCVDIPVRRALLYYFQKRLRLDAGNFKDGAHEKPVVVANRDAFEVALAEAMQ